MLKTAEWVSAMVFGIQASHLEPLGLDLSNFSHGIVHHYHLVMTVAVRHGKIQHFYER